MYPNYYLYFSSIQVIKKLSSNAEDRNNHIETFIEIKRNMIWNSSRLYYKTEVTICLSIFPQITQTFSV